MSADFTIQDRSGKMIAVEVKRRLDTSMNWAREFYRQLSDHLYVSPEQEFWLVTPQKLYIFASRDDEPQAEDAEAYLAPYFRAASSTPESISPRGFEFLVAAALGDLVHSRGDDVSKTESAFFGRLRERLRDGRILVENAA